MSMQAEGQELAAWARMLANGTRATVCLALLDGRAWTATELSRLTHVSRPTISEHLNLLVDGGLLAELRQGRHRYVRLAGPETAELIEGLATLTPRRAQTTNNLAAVSKRDAFARARTCYDHLAGKLGVALTDAMTERGLLDWSDGIALTEHGTAWLHRPRDHDRTAARAARRTGVSGCDRAAAASRRRGRLRAVRARAQTRLGAIDPRRPRAEGGR